MDSQYVKADSTNLPSVDVAMISEYLKSSDKHNIAEIRGAKVMMSSRESYLEKAVGYVELKRQQHTCIVKAKIVPEHRIAQKPYAVCAKIDELKEEIIDSTCEDCPASAGGCKHSVVLLFWLQKRSTEPSSTSVQSYWRKPALANLRNEYVLAADIYPNTKKVQRHPKMPHILKNFVDKSIAGSKLCKDAVVNAYLMPQTKDDMSSYCIFNLLLTFTTTTNLNSFNDFVLFSKTQLTDGIKNKIMVMTKNQADSVYWHAIRQGRITASKLHEVAHCKTADGALVQEILGGYKVFESKAMKRGKLLENRVLQKLESSFKCKINKAGFYIDENVVFGASPDGIFENNSYIVEIKCPTSAKTKNNYIKNSKISDKYMAQVQLQMHCTKIFKTLFCVADEKFEENEKISIMFVDYDINYIIPIMDQAQTFYIQNIFPVILRSASM